MDSRLKEQRVLRLAGEESASHRGWLGLVRLAEAGL